MSVSMDVYITTIQDIKEVEIMRFDIDTFIKIINIYDFDPIEGKDVLIYSKQFENVIDLHSTINYLFSKNTNEIRKEIIDINRNVKIKLTKLLEKRGLSKDDLYKETGYHFDNVRLYDDLEMVKMMLGD